MKHLIKDLWLAFALIIGTSAILLMSDIEQRQSNASQDKREYPTIAIMQISSTPLLDMHIAGVLDRLEEGGYVSTDRNNIRQFNPQGDFSTANTIAREIANGPYDLVITSSTVALQVFSKANQSTKKNHIFGAVTDPVGTGVGITGTEPDQHPPYLAGIGTFQPVQNAFRILHELNPKIKRVGVVWNPGEQCSEACLYEARLICNELGIQLIEAIATNTSEVSEATRSLLSKGVEVIWVGGDTVATASLAMIINLAKQSDIPVFTNDPIDSKAGALFGLGANYFTVGQYTADVAIAVLEGKSPSEFRIENVVPEELSINNEVLASLGKSWSITPKVQALMDQQKTAEKEERITVDFAELSAQGIKPSTNQLENANLFQNVSVKNGRPAKVSLITLVENSSLEEAAQGVEAGMQWSGLKTGVDYIIKSYSAQGEIGQLMSIIDAVVHEKPDVIVTITTPVMMAVMKKVTDIPVVLTVTSDPVKLKVFDKGRPDNVCGVHDNPPVEGLLEMAIENDPQLKVVGIVYDASQMNAVISVEKLREAGKKKSIKVLEVTASSVSELAMATQSLIQRGAKAIIVSADNLVTTGFASIHKVAASAAVPIFATEPKLVEQGATGAYGDSYFEWGKQSGKMVAKIIAGVPPSHLPLTETALKEKIKPINKQKKSVLGRLLKLRIVHYSDTEFAERCHEGLVDGIKKAGFVEGKDYELKVYNAQGDMSTLSSIMSTIKTDRVDLLMVISTPTLQAALRQAGTDTKIVFTGVGDGVQAGAGKNETDHLPNVTGITTRSPFDGMARLIKETMPEAKNVGTLFTPAEINSVLYKDWFLEALKKQGIGLEAIPVTSSADITQATSELCRKNIQVVCQIVDNMTRPGFALIARKASENNMPVYVFDSDQMRDGGVVCLARDYYDAGLEAAEKAVRVLQGENPAMIPFRNTRSEKLIYNPELAEKYRLQLSKIFLEKATVFINQKKN
ncbi:MAG: hypothetical protein CVT92_01780 [Bacteroidetes bacterium HGW-Bacteroidetes-1]|jgi:ABC-type uncharacterized transport system substrate-binding protein|nr:MAG: hypothetical protein CVT92_01780 [Bacteroidetes bacterium HGW-Bacteroidetes-1]